MIMGSGLRKLPFYKYVIVKEFVKRRNNGQKFGWVGSEYKALANCTIGQVLEFPKS